MRKRYLVMAVAGVLAAYGGVTALHTAYAPCGALDRTSGCMSSVALDLVAVGLDPARTVVQFGSFDIALEGRVAVLGLSDRVDGGTRHVLALFDTATGAVLQVLREETGPSNGRADFREVALSPDGRRAAAVFRKPPVDGDTDSFTELVVYGLQEDVPTSVLVRSEAERSFDHCYGYIGFTPDSLKLQCNFDLYDVETKQVTPLERGEAPAFPRPAYAFWDERAPDGTQIMASDLPSPIWIPDAAFRNSFFAPDSTGLLVLQTVGGHYVRVPWYLPKAFQHLSAVEVWDAKTRVLQRSFSSNQEYRGIAWSHESQFFGLVTADLHLQVFRR